MLDMQRDREEIRARVKDFLKVQYMKTHYTPAQLAILARVHVSAVYAAISQGRLQRDDDFHPVLVKKSEGDRWAKMKVRQRRR